MYKENNLTKLFPHQKVGVLFSENLSPNKIDSPNFLFLAKQYITNLAFLYHWSKFI